MSFVNPFFLWGLLGASIPVLVHLLGRRKGKEQWFAAMEFLLASEKRLAARRKLENVLLLLVRMVLLIAVTLAFARPLVEGAVAIGKEAPVSAVAVLDRTASLRARAGGAMVFERARSLLADSIDRLPAGSEVAVLTIELVPRRLTPGFVTPAEALRAVREAAPGYAAGRASGALAEAGVLLAGAHREKRRVLVASDLQRSTWAGEVTTLSVEVAVLDAAPEGIPPNVGLVRARVVPGSVESTIEVEALRSEGLAVAAGPGFDGGGGDDVRAGGEARATDREALVRLIDSGKTANRGLLRFGKGGRAQTTLSAPPGLPPEARVLLELEDGGSLDADDRLDVILDRPPVLRVLIANGAPSADLYRDELFYLERALESEPARFRRRTVDASMGRLGKLEDADVIVLANVPRLDERDAKALSEAVERGKGLLVTAGDRVDTVALDRTLGSTLGVRILSVIEVRQGEPPLGLGALPASPHPVLSPFDASASFESLLSVRMAKVLAVEPGPEAVVVLRYTNDLPAIVLGRHGEGRTALVTTTIDRDWTDLPVKPGFLPALTRLILHLGKSLESERRRDFTVGERVTIELDPGDEAQAALRVETPAGEALEIARTGPLTFALEGAQEPGVYRVFCGDRAEAALDFAVRLEPAECDLARASAGEVKAVAGANAEVRGGATGSGREAESALPLLLVAALASALEALLARGPRGGDRKVLTRTRTHEEVSGVEVAA